MPTSDNIKATLPAHWANHVVTRVIDMFELAMRHDIPEVKDRRGNWVQQYGLEDDARLFATAQFRRYRELADKHLPKLKEIQSITKQIKGGSK